ncbi:hypothetical protein EDD16DRAFT_1424130, partial [Pisolithus croceorrhizus]
LVQWFPTTHGLSDHCPFISTFMLASGKVIYDDMYSIKSWCTVTQQIFQLWEILGGDNAPLEMCQYSEWELNHGP